MAIVRIHARSLVPRLVIRLLMNEKCVPVSRLVITLTRQMVLLGVFRTCTRIDSGTPRSVALTSVVTVVYPLIWTVQESCAYSPEARDSIAVATVPPVPWAPVIVDETHCSRASLLSLAPLTLWRPRSIDSDRGAFAHPGRHSAASLSARSRIVEAAQRRSRQDDAAPHDRPRARLFTAKNPCPHRIEDGFDEEQQGDFERRQVSDRSCQADVRESDLARHRGRQWSPTPPPMQQAMATQTATPRSRRRDSRMRPLTSRALVVSDPVRRIAAPRA